MPQLPKHKGPWTHRALVWAFSLLFALFTYWLLGFVVNDLGTWPGPSWARVEAELLAPQLLQQSEQLTRQIEEANRAIADQRQRQTVLRDSTSNSEKTMNQLLEIQRLSLQKGVVLSATEQAALDAAKQLFLTYQTRYQESNDRVSALSEELRTLQEQQRTLSRDLEARRQPIRHEFDARQTRHNLQVAALKLAVLLPLLGLAVWLFLRKRTSLYAVLNYGFGLAVLIKVVLVMHEHFPRRYFKYVLIVAALALVARILVGLLRMVDRPKPDWLLKQYREAYEAFLCPVCQYPIRRGPLKFMAWTRRSLRKLPVPRDALASADEPYVCPCCATPLFEECEACHAVRHALLPACSHCGKEKALAGRSD